MTPREHQFVPDNLSYFQADIEASSSDGSMQPAWHNPSIQHADLIFMREMCWTMVDPMRVIENAKRYVFLFISVTLSQFLFSERRASALIEL